MARQPMGQYHPKGHNSIGLRNSTCCSSSPFSSFPGRNWNPLCVRILLRLGLSACLVSSWISLTRLCSSPWSSIHDHFRLTSVVPDEWMQSLISVRTSRIDPDNETQTLPLDANNNSDIMDADTLLALSSSSTTKIPRIIYIFWDQGWPAMDEYRNGTRMDKLLPLPRLARSSWEFHNNAYNKRSSHMRNSTKSSFQMVALDGPLAEKLTDRSQFIPDSIFLDLSVQAKSDIYRTLLLHRYGGIWVDASLFCNLPLDNFLDLNATDLVTFRRDDDKGAKNGFHIQPWITSWFLAAPPRSYMITKILDCILRNVTHSTNASDTIFVSEYFWWHRIVEQLAHQDAYVYNRIMHDYASADPMHCWTPGWEFHAPVLKRCPKTKAIYSIFATSILHCCRTDKHLLPYNDSTINPIRQNHNQAGEWESLCVEWNCSMHSDNIRHVPKLEALYSSQGEHLPTWTSDFYTAAST